MCKFRLLRADEVECRIGQLSEKGVSLLLYKDARCDMAILDESVGSLNWQRSHLRDNANCVVSIWDGEKKEWISKEDTGTESNTEAEKGLASDSFKRACVNWGIGRELYTAPRIWIPADKCNIKGNKCYDKFEVSEIGYTDNRTINHLVIVCNGKEVYRLGAKAAPTAQLPECAYIKFPDGPHAGDTVANVWKSDFDYIRMYQNVGSDEGIKLAIRDFAKYLRDRNGKH